MASIQSSTDPRFQPEISLRDRLAGLIQGATNLLPTSMQSFPDIPQLGVKGGTLAESLQTPVENIPGIAQGVSAEDLGQAVKDKSWLGAGLAMLGMMPGGRVEKNAAEELIKPAAEAGRDTVAKIKAYHGSPHSFDRFSLDKIGTGEGAQAYGHGLYFAENEGVAKSYRDALAGGSTKWLEGDRVLSGAEQNAATLLEHWKGDKQKALSDIKYSLRPMRSADHKYLDETEAALARLDPAKLRVEQDPGHMYEVNINADPEAFLDWDKPLSEQPELKQKLGDVLRWQQVPLKNNMGEDTTASQMVDFLERKGGKPFATEELRDAGIPGIKYLDAGSRGSGDGSRNYVVFDDKIIDIVKKYGIAGALSAGLITQQMADQMQQQGIEG